MNKQILTPEVQAFIRQHAHENASHIALKKSPFTRVSSAELAQQVLGRQKASIKIPAWLEQDKALYFPEKLNLEQCSSAITGKYKASLLSPESTLLDLTGGFGVDSYYFAQRAKKVIHCEINPLLSQIVTYNMKALGMNNIQCYAVDGIGFLQKSDDRYDYLFVDPSRRVNSQKVFQLTDCEPDITAYQALFFRSARILITKLAPLLDISGALRVLPNVKEVYVISTENDCKELLLVQDQFFAGTPTISAVRLTANGPQVFSFTYAQEKTAEPQYGKPNGFLYDPDVALTKAGAFKSTATSFNLHKISQNSHLYSSDRMVSDFPGRILHIRQVKAFSIFKKSNDIKKANIVAKNFPLKVEDIRKKFKIKDGGEDYLYFTRSADNERIVIHAVRIS